MAKEKITEEGLKNFLLALSGGMDKSDNESLGLLIEKFEKEFKIDQSPEDCYFYHWYDIDRAFDLYSKKFCVVEKKASYLTELYRSHKYIEPVLTEVMTRTEGSACCADRSRWLINRYVKYLKTGEMFTMERPEKCYWMPHFGTVDQWVELIESVIGLRYGKYFPFVKIIGEIHEAAKEYRDSVEEEES